MRVALVCFVDMKRFLALALGGSLLFPSLFALPAAAATLNPGDLIKGPGEAVYYYAANGKRLVFPSSKTYFTWYANFNTVKTVTAGELAAIPLGGNVTYRPGVKLVKITTDPRTYAVASNGTLRWIETEAVAKELYGSDWNTKVDDVADAFFINYTIGASIKNSSDFSPTGQMSAATDINTDRHLVGGAQPSTPSTPTNPNPTTPTSTPSTPNSSMTFTTSKTTLQAGDVLALTTQAVDPAGISKIELYFDGILIKRCDNTPACSGETVIPSSGTKTSYEVKSVVTTLGQNVMQESKTLQVENNGSNKVRVTLGQSTIMPNQAASVIADVDASIAILRIDISVNGTTVKGCATGARQCQWSDFVSGNVGQTMPVFAIVTDTLGRTYTSKTLTLTIGTNDSPSVNVTPAKTSIFVGESVEATVTASDNDGISKIEVLKDGVVLKTCESAQPCTVLTGPWTQAGAALQFSGRATDTKGMTSSADAVDTVSVVNP